MKKDTSICVLCIGIFVLCLELYMVKLVQMMERLTRIEWHTNVWNYLKEPILLVPFIATILVIIYSICSALGLFSHRSD